MDIAQTIALTMGVAWASGINLYAAILMLGLLVDDPIGGQDTLVGATLLGWLTDALLPAAAAAPSAALHDVCIRADPFDPGAHRHQHPREVSNRSLGSTPVPENEVSNVSRKES